MGRAEFNDERVGLTWKVQNSEEKEMAMHEWLRKVLERRSLVALGSRSCSLLQIVATPRLETFQMAGFGLKWACYRQLYWEMLARWGRVGQGLFHRGKGDGVRRKGGSEITNSRGFRIRSEVPFSEEATRSDNMKIDVCRPRSLDGDPFDESQGKGQSFPTLMTANQTRPEARADARVV
jgi:hypothetical protein